MINVIFHRLVLHVDLIITGKVHAV